MSSLREELRRAFDSVALIDTHSHISPVEREYDRTRDILSDLIADYTLDDFISVGLSDEAAAQVLDSGGDLLRRWGLLEPYWPLMCDTGYARMLLHTLRGVYGADHIGRDNLALLNEKYLELHREPGQYHRILKERCHTETAISDCSLYNGLSGRRDEAFFKLIFRMDHLIFPRDMSDLRRVEEECGYPVNSFDDIVSAVPVVMDKALDAGMIGFKCGLAYCRSLEYSFPDYAQARRDFEAVRRSRVLTPNGKVQHFVLGKDFQDFMMHEVMRAANKRGVVFQFHSGYHAGRGNHLDAANPVLLSNLFLEYQNVKFHVLHAGHPFFRELGVLAKQFPNVYADLCWAHVVSPYDARAALESWLESVPAGKILAYGDDLVSIDLAAGHLQVARENICEVLENKVAAGRFTLERAKEVLRLILRDNANRLYGLA